MDSGTNAKRNVLERLLLDESAEPTDLPLSLLEEITNSFSEDLEIGRGGSAVVYKGMLGDRTIAVKKLLNTHLHEKKFHQEIECLMKVKHRNIVRFLGYCADTQGNIEKYNGKFVMADVQHILLCFEFLPAGSLDKHITDASCGLEWRQRYRIIEGICKGLQYLHQNQIVHLDLRPSNILLDENMLPKITDFGLLRCFGETQSRTITSKLIGSIGHFPQEFYSGIYSLGIIITEILTGKRGYCSVDDRDDSRKHHRSIEKKLAASEWNIVVFTVLKWQEVDNQMARICSNSLARLFKCKETIWLLHRLDWVLEFWRNRLDKSQEDRELKQVRVCAEICIECTESNPEKRPGIENIINRLYETKSTDSIEIGVGNSSVPQAEPYPSGHQGTPANNSPGETS